MGNFSIDEITRQIKLGEKNLGEISDFLPCYMHLNSLEDFSVLEADNKVIKYFDLSIDEINEGGFSLLEKVVNREDLLNAVNVNLNYLENKANQSHVAFLQRIEFQTQKKELLFFTKGKILDDNRILNLSVRIDDMDIFNRNIYDICESTDFVQNNVHKYNRLTLRELEVCRLLARGLKIQEIGDNLDVSPHTIKNFKIKIYRKLEVKNFFEFYKVCKKFNLIA